MDHDTLEKLKHAHPALKLLNADHMPLIISFLYKVFIEPNQRSLSASDLESMLSDYLYHLREIHGDHKYSRSAKAYLEDWASGESAFLRKYYTHLSDEPEFDLTPATEKAVEWLQSLGDQRFIGTASRLLTVFQLLREIVHGTETDPRLRIASLERQKAEIESKIERIRQDGIVPYDATQVKERFFHVEETARRLLADFRQVEYNFRDLDRETRERIATSDKTKGALLDEIFRENDVIWDSDQGRSFRSFWEFLMSPNRQADLEELLDAVYALDEIRNINPDPFLAHIKFYLLEAGEKVYKTNNLLVEQLRKYLDDQAYLENKRIIELIKSIEKQAIAVKDQPPSDRQFAKLDALKPDVDLIMSRGLFIPPKNPDIWAAELKQGTAEIEVSALYRHDYVDERELKNNIRKALQSQAQISLAQLVRRYPIRRGIAEVLTYLNLAGKDDKAVIADDENERLVLIMTTGEQKEIQLPKVIFIR